MSDKKQDVVWCYSTDEGIFHGDCATREEAIELLRDEQVCTGIDEGWIGKSGKRTPFSGYASVERLIDMARDSASSDMGELAGEFLGHVTPEAQKELAGLLDTWATKHGHQPNFGPVVEVEEMPAAQPTGEEASDE